MQKKTLIIAATVAVAVVLIAIPLFRGMKKKVNLDFSPGVEHKVEVIDIAQASSYTYIQVKEEGVEYWIAGNKREVKTGDMLYFADALKMDKFPSKELKRTFDSIYFIQNLSDQPIGDKKAKFFDDLQAKKKEAPEKKDIRVEKPEGGITVADLFENHAKYAGKTVKVRGVVTKFSAMIMDRNWVHIQDGTDFSGNFDLAVTTQDMVKEGSTVTFTGTVSVNKDFGAGYFYKVIIEQAASSDITPAE